MRPGTYALKGGETKAALTVRGDGITVDFTGVTLRGTPEATWPDARTGTGLRVEGRNVTIKGLHARGYKVALLAKGVRGLRLLDCDLSYNWKARLRSTPGREDEADWMSFHHNEKEEWLRYGAGAYLDGCDGFEVRGLRVTGGQCGLMLNRSNGGLVWNCDLSYNSGLGLGMYRSCECRIMHNRLDYDVRGFSYGVYNRGQDSAGILVFEQCMRNLFAYNSVTHGGDGFFLWAGQTTMDTGEGGCNDNLCYANDFSYAPTNAIEATFSRNAFVGNRVRGAFHGLWGGYSYDTRIVGNDFVENQRGIAIEHGGANEIVSNRFRGEDVAIALWAEAPDPLFAYAKARDVRSRDARIVGNEFRGTALALDLRGTTNTLVEGNLFASVGQAARYPPAADPFSPLPVENRAAPSATMLPGRVRTVPFPDGPEPVWDPLHLEAEGPKPLKGGMMPFLARNAPQGWRTILVDEWGPYDGRRPLLWPEKTAGGGAPLPGGTSAGSGRRKADEVRETGRYQVLGPKGRWRLVSAEGATLGATGGAVPGFVRIDVPKDRVGTTRVELEYVGAATTDVRGVVTPAGRPVRFGFSRFDAPIRWNVEFFRWKESLDPKDPHSPPNDIVWTFVNDKPLKTLRTDRLDFTGAALVPGLPPDHTATLAVGEFESPIGDYEIELTTDDGARLTLDGKPLIDAWHYQGPTAYRKTVHLTRGKHHLAVEHFQIDGYATLRVAIRPKPKVPLQ